MLSTNAACHEIWRVPLQVKPMTVPRVALRWRGFSSAVLSDRAQSRAHSLNTKIAQDGRPRTVIGMRVSLGTKALSEHASSSISRVAPL